MLDLSPEKLMVLLALGLVVLGPDKLPAAARGLAHSVARGRRLAASLTDPITTTVTEPLKASLTEPIRDGLAEHRQAMDSAIADLRSAIANHTLPGPDHHVSPIDPTLN